MIGRIPFTFETPEGEEVTIEPTICTPYPEGQDTVDKYFQQGGYWIESDPTLGWWNAYKLRGGVWTADSMVKYIQELHDIAEQKRREQEEKARKEAWARSVIENALQNAPTIGGVKAIAVRKDYKVDGILIPHIPYTEVHYAGLVEIPSDDEMGSRLVDTYEMSEEGCLIERILTNEYKDRNDVAIVGVGFMSPRQFAERYTEKGRKEKAERERQQAEREQLYAEARKWFDRVRQFFIGRGEWMEDIEGISGYIRKGRRVAYIRKDVLGAVADAAEMVSPREAEGFVSRVRKISDRRLFW
ncbi:hypothetical protein DRJ19_02870, partial [Candidatus Woesearchaeota archaeon]